MPLGTISELPCAGNPLFWTKDHLTAILRIKLCNVAELSMVICAPLSTTKLEREPVHLFDGMSFGWQFTEAVRSFYKNGIVLVPSQTPLLLPYGNNAWPLKTDNIVSSNNAPYLALLTPGEVQFFQDTVYMGFDEAEREMLKKCGRNPADGVDLYIIGLLIALAYEQKRVLKTKETFRTFVLYSDTPTSVVVFAAEFPASYINGFLSPEQGLPCDVTVRYKRVPMGDSKAGLMELIEALISCAPEGGEVRKRQSSNRGIRPLRGKRSLTGDAAPLPDRVERLREKRRPKR